MEFKTGDIVKIIGCVEEQKYKGEVWEVQFLTRAKDHYRIENLKTGYRDTYHKDYLRKVKV